MTESFDSVRHFLQSTVDRTSILFDVGILKGSEERAIFFLVVFAHYYFRFIVLRLLSRFLSCTSAVTFKAGF